MKKRLLILAAALLALAIAFGLGVLAFSGNNLGNRIEGREELTLSVADLDLVGWQYDSVRGVYISGIDSQIILKRLPSKIGNVRFLGAFDGSVTSVEVFYTTAEGESFTAEKCVYAPVERKNDDIYLLLGESLASHGVDANSLISLRLDIYGESGREAEISAFEFNPRKLNINVTDTILAFLLAFLTLFSLVELFFDRRSLMKDLLAMKRYKYLLSDLVKRDIKTKYRRSALGILWSVLNPLLMMLILTAIFSNILRVEVEGGFALFYLSGYIIFNFISEATNFALYTITNAAPLIKKVYVPKYIFPLEKCIFSFVNMVSSLSAFAIVFVIFAIMGRVNFAWTMLLFPLPMLLAFVFCLGLSLILASLLVFFRDIGHIWSIFMTVWMYATPIIYPMEMVPSWLANIIRMNPLYYYVDIFRGLMVYGRLPSAATLLVAVAWALAALLFGVYVFRRKQDRFILYI